MSVSITVGAYGVAFGRQRSPTGFTVLQSCLLSLLTFSGASQFAVIGVIGAGGSALSGIATASLSWRSKRSIRSNHGSAFRSKGLKRVIAGASNN